MYKGALIFFFGGIFGSLFGVLGGGIVGYFGGTIWAEVMKDEGKKEAMSRVHYQGMSTKPKPKERPMTQEEAEEFIDTTVEKIKDALLQAKSQSDGRAEDLDESTPRT